MKRALIITSAGCSTRFSRSIGRDVSKVLYFEGDPKECLLGCQLELVKDEGFDVIVIVGGYMFTQLRDFVASHYGSDQRIKVVFNDKFREYGTCYSFACGLNALQDYDLDEIVFMEGDLAFDKATFTTIVSKDRDIITASQGVIHAETSVIFYVSMDNSLHYIYDARHEKLHINDSFIILGNSGQVWKFCDVNLLRKTVNMLGVGLCDDTNLLPVENYFNARGLKHVAFLTFDSWINCNTIDDYVIIRKFKEKFREKR